MWIHAIIFIQSGSYWFRLHVSVCSFRLWLLDLEYFIVILLRLPSMVLIHACRRLSRDYLLAFNSQCRCVAVLDTTIRDLISRLRLRRRGCRAGEHQRRSLVQNVNINNRRSHVTRHSGEIPVIIGRRANVNIGQLFDDRCDGRDGRDTVVVGRRVLTVVKLQDTAQHTYNSILPSHAPQKDSTGGTPSPSLYVLNAAAITKLHAVEHLTADLSGYNVDVAVVTETHLKSKHADHHFAVGGYTLFRRDRIGRRGGGVAVYVSSRLSADVWTCPGDSVQYELLWLRVRAEAHTTFVGALYHPPKPQYQTATLLAYIEAGVDAAMAACPSATIVLAGDFNALDDTEVATRSALL